jgi:hypothetical protein
MKVPKACHKFRNADAVAFIEHAHNDRCLKCLALLRYFERDTALRKLMWESRAVGGGAYVNVTTSGGCKQQ